MFRNSAVFLFALISAGVANAPVALAESLPAGTELIIRLDQPVNPASKDSKDSKHFSASVAFPVFSHGREVIPGGSRIEGEVRGDKKLVFLSPRQLILPDGQKIDFHATVGAVDHKRLAAERGEGTIGQEGNAGEAVQQAAQIGMTGAQIGAMSTGSLKGMGIGAAAGVGAVLIGRTIWGRRRPTIIPAGTQMTLNLTQPLEIPDGLENAQPLRVPFSGDDDSIAPQDRRPILRRQPSTEPQQLT